ncbi:hypothetical protein V3C99_015032 [Haemonchus contortus]|uniref:Uncharacterized protein n=1 Tax=Haemonchus contortus TaxID=6289 RepID=A0A7I4YVZ6_HAECO
MAGAEVGKDVVKKRHRTCCSICHIKFGTAILGAAEAIVCVMVLLSAIQQIVWKKGGSHNCSDKVFEDCLIFHFSHFDITLIFDYIVIAIISFMLFSICLLMYGILTDTSCLLLPHILIQAVLLLFSIGYFCLYAVSYFYGDIYKHSRPFKSIQFIERMWLATLLLALAAFQTYLFSSVIRCSMYISGIEEERRRRAGAFDRVSERVRLAKEQGVWRPVSLEDDKDKESGVPVEEEIEPKRSSKKGHVQWNVQTSVIEEEDETAITSGTSFQPTPRRSSRQLEAVDEVMIQPLGRAAQHRRKSSDSPRKDRIGSTVSTQMVTATNSKTGPGAVVMSDIPSTSKAVRMGRDATSSGRRKSPSMSPNRLSSERTSHRSRYSVPDAGQSLRKQNGPRPPLQRYKSCDTDNPPASPTTINPSITNHGSARRTSLGNDDRVAPATNRRGSSGQANERPYSHIKKVSIAATRL